MIVWSLPSMLRPVASIEVSPLLFSLLLRPSDEFALVWLFRLAAELVDMPRPTPPVSSDQHLSHTRTCKERRENGQSGACMRGYRQQWRWVQRTRLQLRRWQ